MKTRILIIAFLSLLLFNCKDDEGDPCVFDQISPSLYKEYVPYNGGETIVFKNSNGQEDTLSVISFNNEDFVGFRQDCPFKHEKIRCEIKTNWQDSLSFTADHIINFFDWAVSKNSLVISTKPQVFQATNFDGPASGEIIETLNVVEFSGTTYFDVILASCRLESECNFVDSIGFVKGKGLAFYSLYGEPWILEE